MSVPKVHGLSETEVAEFKEIFDMVDKDQGGSIEKEELEELMRTLGLNPSKEELNAMVEEIDQDGNGEIEFEEFVAVMAKKVNLSYSPEDVLAAFKLFERYEKEQNAAAPAGTISYNTLESALQNYGKIDNDKVSELLNTVEFDDSGRLNYSEYVNMMMSG